MGDAQRLALDGAVERARAVVGRLVPVVSHLVAVSREVAVVRREAEREAEQPGPERSPRVVLVELLEHGQEHVVRHVLEIAIVDAEPAQRVPPVAEMVAEDLLECGTGGRFRNGLLRYPLDGRAGGHLALYLGEAPRFRHGVSTSAPM